MTSPDGYIMRIIRSPWEGGSSGRISGIHPNNLKRLYLSYRAWGEDSFFCSKYNRYKMKLYISPPQTLEYLKFEYRHFPFKACEYLKFQNLHQYIRCGTLKADILPPNLTINKTQLPSTLEILKFYGKNFSHGKIENDSKFKIFETDSLPNGLKKFIVSRYPGFNQNIQVNNFFPISCTYIYLIGFMRPIPTKLKDGAVVSIFPENLKELIFFELIIISHRGRGPFQFYQPLIKFNCLPLYLITLVLDYHYYYLDIINGVFEKIKWLPTTLKNLTFNTFNIKTFRFLGNLTYYKSKLYQNFSNCPFDNFDIISSLKYLQISDVYYID
ncbi:hypothetical protein ACTFIT_010830 [Dictyostelium discoideum]